MSAHPPSCVGNYERDDDQCDGSEADPYACAWRDKCGAFKAHLSESRASSSKWIDGDGKLIVDLGDFNLSSRRWMETYDIVDGLPRAPVIEQQSMGLDELFDLFLTSLIRDVGIPYAAPGSLALPGQLYLRDHRTRHNYATVYYRARRGHDRPLARVRTRPRDKAIEVWLPVTARVAAKLGISARVLTSRGQFKSELVLNQVNAVKLAKKIAGLVDEGKIQLPRRPT